MGMTTAGDDYGLGLCHTCVKAYIAFKAMPSPNGGNKLPPAPVAYAITMAPALVPVPTPGGETAYNAAITLPACLEHLEIARDKKPPPEPRRRQLLVP
jgi:hypothetical protein